MMREEFNASAVDRRLIWLVVVAGMATLVGIGFRYSSGHLSDFAGYYTAAKVFSGEDSLSRLYDDGWFKDRVSSVVASESTFVMYVNPPTVAILMFPLHSFDPFLAKLLWNSLSIVFIVITFVLGCRYFNVPRGSVLEPLLFGLLASTLPFFRNLQRGQVYVFMLGLVLLLLLGYRDKNPWLTGIPLSFLILLKYFGWMFLILFLVERRWKELCVTCFSLVVGVCIMLAVTGAQTYYAHLEYLFAVFQRNDFAFTGLPSFQALFGALFIPHPQFNPDPVADLPWLAQTLTLTVLVTSLFLSLRWGQYPDDRPQSRPLAILVLSIVFTPLAADHHYILMIPAAFFILSIFLDSPVSWRTLILGFLLIYALLGWYPSLQIGKFGGFDKLCCFPRLYAAVALWLVIILQRRQETPNGHDPRLV